VQSNYQRIAVFPFDTKWADGRSMADSFITQFLSLEFTIVDRSLIQAILQEMNVTDPTVLSKAQLQKLKQEANADAIVFGSIDAKKPGTEIDAVSLRMIDLNTGDVLISSSFKNDKQIEAGQIPGQMIADIRGAMRQIASQRVREAGTREKIERKKQSQFKQDLPDMDLPVQP